MRLESSSPQTGSLSVGERPPNKKGHTMQTRKTDTPMSLLTRKRLSVAAMQLDQPVVLVKSDAADKAELRRYRLRDQRAEAAAVALSLLAETTTKTQARNLHLSRTAHVRDNTEAAPQKVTLMKHVVHTTLPFDPVRAVPLPVPWWRRVVNWFKSELE
jgi:hypothetical protein